MKFLSKEQILYLHSMSISQTGGLDGIRDEGLLDSALKSPLQSFGGTELYPSIQTKVARLAFNLIKNHPFIDGNKRIGILAMMVLLEINSIIVICNDNDIIDLGLGIADGRYDHEYIVNWIIIHSSN